jgi:hypothetical protein
MSVALPSSVLFFPPLIVNKARGNDASRGQMDVDLTRATQTTKLCLDGPPTYAVAGSMGVDAIACAHACVSLVRAGWLGSKTVPLCLCEIRPTSKFCPPGGWWPTPSILLLLPLAGSA